jgi:hypothetical protein
MVHRESSLASFMLAAITSASLHTPPARLRHHCLSSLRLAREETMYDKSNCIPVEVYLPSAVFRGQLFMKHARLSDYLNVKANDEMIRLDDVEIQSFKGTFSPVKSQHALIYKRQVTFVVDLSTKTSAARENPELSLVNKDAHRVLIEIGSFWMQGDVHIIHGLELNTFADGKSFFIPLTAAKFVDLPDSEPRTFLVNRGKVNCLLPLTEALPAAAYPAIARQR